MTTTQTTNAFKNNADNAFNADSMLRDMAFVLRMTRKLKSEMLVELTTETEESNYGPFASELCAV